jgi:hypothetical protein
MGRLNPNYIVCVGTISANPAMLERNELATLRIDILQITAEFEHGIVLWRLHAERGLKQPSPPYRWASAGTISTPDWMVTLFEQLCRPF